MQIRHREARHRRIRVDLARLVKHDRRAARERVGRVAQAVLARALKRDERGARNDLAAVEREIRQRESRVRAGVCAEDLAEDSIAWRERGHHGNTCACATTVSGAAGSASGGTASTRSAPVTMFENTGAATSAP